MPMQRIFGAARQGQPAGTPTSQSFWGQPVFAWPDRLRPNGWDIAAIPLVLGLMALLAFGWRGITQPYELGAPLEVSLDPEWLPYYALRSVLRMGAALVASLLFTLLYATLAAKSCKAERVLIPVLDVLQSVPILGFLSITVTGFIALFPGSLLGVECASIFAIFTSQAWNMTFSLYQSLRTVPGEQMEAARMYHLGAWKTFWKLEVPWAMPNLVWNMMMSVSGGWFFVVASEAITVRGQTISLPGIGSYIAAAIDARNLAAVGWAVLAMFVVIVLYDQLFFRPLLAWSTKFRSEASLDEEIDPPWFLRLIQRARVVDLMGRAAALPSVALARLPTWRPGRARRRLPRLSPRAERLLDRVWSVLVAIGAVFIAAKVALFVSDSIGMDEVWHVVAISAATALRVVLLIVAATLVWVPIGVWIGMRPGLTRVMQPIVQFMAAFPANLFFPVAVVLIVHFNANVEVWISPLMILGTQWYILFNVIAGASSIPNDLHYVSQNLGVSRWLWWRRLAIPAILPAYVTGALTASGGSWNASIVSEVVKWGDTKLTATGVGAYIADATEAGDFPRVALGIAVLCLYVILFNRLVWRRLYDYAAERQRMQ